MEEKKTNEKGASAILLIITIIVIAIMGYFTYKFYNDKITETKRADELQAQVNSLNGKVQELNIEKNSTKKETDNTSKNTNSDINENISNETESKEVEGFFINEESGKDAEYYEFFKSEKRVNYLNGTVFYYGTYDVLDNKITIKITEKIEIGGSTGEEINETRVLEFINNNTLQDENNTKYINKNTINSAYVSENSTFVGGDSIDDDRWYTFYYNGGVRYSDSENRLYGTYEIKGDIVTITYYFCENKEIDGLDDYNGSKILKSTNDGFFDEELNINYKRYADGW